ncbi:hypothetical protein F7P69_28520 [Cellulosimicrobium funkei]|nr:hypothetical protein [Cellulosimicrobium funkei]
MTSYNPQNHPDPEGDALEDEITRGTVYDRHYDARRTAEADGTADVGPEKPGLRTGTLVWGVIALLVALWSLSVTVLDWDVDPVLVMIGLAVVGGVALLAGGIAGAARSRTR